MEAARRIWEAKFPAIKLRSLTSEYNCFGMVFASRRTWIADGDVVEKTIFPDEGFSKVAALQEVKVGDVVVYRKTENGPIEHVGLVVEVKIPDPTTYLFLILSQWGEDGEYLHHTTDVPPDCGTYVEYWSEKVQLT